MLEPTAWPTSCGLIHPPARRAFGTPLAAPGEHAFRRHASYPCGGLAAELWTRHADLAIIRCVPPLPSFIEATRVERVAGTACLYRASLTREWDAPVFPSGGIVTALALRAMATELDQVHQRLRSFATMFVSTVDAGEIDVEVEQLRTGNRMSQLRANVRSAGRTEPGHVTTAAFGESREGFEFAYAVPPEAGPPDDYPGFAAPPPGVPAWRSRFFENVDVRRVRMFSSFETNWAGGRAETVRWMRYRIAPRLADGRIDPLSLIALADTMPPAVGQHHGPGFPFYHAPSVDLSMKFFADTDEEWLLAHVISHWAGDGYASADVTLWDAKRRLLAHGTQLMLIRFPDPKDLGIVP
jgi:acyl-CoA thioesterase